MVTVVTKTVGTTGRDYSLPQLWEDAAPADLVAADTLWRGVGYNDSEFIVVGTVLETSGSVSDATRYKEFTVAAGQSLCDDPTAPLRLDPTKGVTFKCTGGYTQALKLNEAYARVSRVQIYSTPANSGPFLSNTATSRIEQCLLSGQNNGGAATAGLISKAFNCVFIQTNTTGAGLSLADNVKVKFCTVVASAGSSGRAWGFNYAFDGIYSSFGMNFATIRGAPGGAYPGLVFDCATDLAAVSAGSSTGFTFNIPYSTATFLNVTTATLDLRLNPASAQATAATWDADCPRDFYGTLRSVTTPSRGAFEVAAAGGVSLAGSFQAVATLTPTATVTKPLAASAGAVATLSPVLAVAKPLAVTAAGSATLTAALSVAKPLAVIAPAVAALTAALSAAKPLGVSAGAVATLTPALTVAMPLAMSAGAVASVNATLSIAGTVSLAMTAGAVATLTPAATVTKPLALSAGGVATLTAALSVAKPLAVLAGAVATITADLNNQGVGSLAMLAGAVATFTPALSVAKPLGMLAGGVASFSGTVQAGTPLAVTMGAQASLVAALSVSKPLAMSPAAQATLTAALTVVPGAGLAVLMQAQATLSAALSVAMPLSVVMGAQATLGGGLSNVSPGGAVVAPTEYDLFVLLGGLFQSLTDVEIIRGQGNRTPVPSALNYIVITPMGSVQKATPVSIYGNTVQNVQVSQSREYTVSVDCFGPESNRWATILSMVLKTPWACDSFPEGIDPLYAGDPKQFPLIDGEQQYEDRWRFDAVLHYTPVVTLSQQSAVTLALTLVSVDASYPPGA